jgi:hypothetical protein
MRINDIQKRPKKYKKIDIFASVGAAYVSPLSGFAPPWRVQYSLKKTKKEPPSVRKTRFCWKMQIIGKKISMGG